MEFPGGDSVEFVVQPVYGATYWMQRTDSLTPVAWEDIEPVDMGAGYDLPLVDPDGLATTICFYRILL